MRQFYVGQKMYYLRRMERIYCKVLGWNNQYIFIQECEGSKRKFKVPRHLIGYDLHYDVNARQTKKNNWLPAYNNDREKYQNITESGGNAYSESNSFDGNNDYTKERRHSGGKKRDRDDRLKQYNEERYKQ
jgi:general stress protein YciG